MMKSQSTLGTSSIVLYVAHKPKVTRLTTNARLRNIFEWVIQDLKRFGKCRYQSQFSSRKEYGKSDCHNKHLQITYPGSDYILLLLRQVQILVHERISFFDEGPAM